MQLMGIDAKALIAKREYKQPLELIIRDLSRSTTVINGFASVSNALSGHLIIKYDLIEYQLCNICLVN